MAASKAAAEAAAAAAAGCWLPHGSSDAAAGAEPEPPGSGWPPLGEKPEPAPGSGWPPLGDVVSRSSSHASARGSGASPADDDACEPPCPPFLNGLRPPLGKTKSEPAAWLSAIRLPPCSVSCSSGDLRFFGRTETSPEKFEKLSVSSPDSTPTSTLDGTWRTTPSKATERSIR